MNCKKKNRLVKYTLCISLLTSVYQPLTSSPEVCGNEDATLATAGALAFVKDPAHAQTSLESFLKTLAHYDEEHFKGFLEPYTKNLELPAPELVAQLTVSNRNFPTELQDYLTRTDKTKLIEALNEAVAMELLLNLVAKNPKYPIQKWPRFIDTLTTLLAKSEQYKEFCAALKTLKNASRLAIMLTLKRYLPILPPQIRKNGETTGLKEIFFRRISW